MDGNLLDLVVRAARSVEVVLAGLDPGDEGRATPCPELTVVQVAAHLIGGMAGFTTVAEGGELRFDAESDPSFAQERPVVAFRAAVDALVSAFAVPGRLDASYAMPWGPTTGGQLVGFELIEIVVHGWDLARGLGVELAVENEVAGAALAGARLWVDDSVRVPGMFGPEVSVQAVTPLEELVAFLGRDPAWRPDPR